MPKKKSEHPLCTATLKDGSPCRSVAVEQGMCVPHARKAAAAEAEASGSSVDQSAVEGAAVAAVSESDSFSVSSEAGRPSSGVVEDSGSLTAEPRESVPVASLRGSLRTGLMTEEIAGLIRENILAGLSAVKEQYMSCRKCGTRSPVQVADLGTRVSAAEKLLDQLDGKLRAESATVDEKLNVALKQAESDLASCTDEELQLIAMATHDGEPPSMKDAARRLAAELIADSEASPQGWLAERLSPAELDFLQRISSHHFWGSFPSSLIEAAEVVVSASAEDSTPTCAAPSVGTDTPSMRAVRGR